MAQHFVYVIPANEGKFYLRKTGSMLRLVKDLKEFLAVGPIPLPHPPTEAVTAVEAREYFEMLRRSGYAVKNLSENVSLS